MKTINKYLLEKLHISKNIKTANKDIVIKFYTFDWDKEMINRDHTWKTLKFPVAEYVIYKDNYRKSKMHLATFTDMLYNIYMCEDDFEDFNPKDDIIYYSNDPKDIVTWYIKDFLKMNLPDKYKDTGDWYNNEFTTEKSKKIADDMYILGEFYNDPKRLEKMSEDMTDILYATPQNISNVVADNFERQF